ncbi:MAG TPA: CHRD domain-containing protein [Terriglobales bacterium]|jgi:hypothetical protein
MKKFCLLALCMACFSLMANADNHKRITLDALLIGVNETPPTASNAIGIFKAVENSDGNFDFTLTFSGLAANAAVSHIHFGLTKESGGVMIFLCGGGNQPACPDATSGTITGTFGAANVTGPIGQGVAVGDFATALKQVLRGASYANLHNATFPGGEIRGKVNVHVGRW